MLIENIIAELQQHNSQAAPAKAKSKSKKVVKVVAAPAAVVAQPQPSPDEVLRVVVDRIVTALGLNQRGVDTEFVLRAVKENERKLYGTIQ